MTRLFKKIILAGICMAFLAGSTLPEAFAAQSVDVNLPTFKMTMNDVQINNSERLYPIIVYRDITYVPMTYNDSRFLGLETKWSADTGLQVNKISEQIPYNPNKGYLSTSLENAVLPDFQIKVNGKDIDNNSETYPLLVFRDITYFPLTWRFMVDSFGWTSSFDLTNGLVITSAAGSTGSTNPISTTPVTNERIYSRSFGNTTVFFDRSSTNQPGNLYVKENNRTKKIGNPDYIYGVGYLQAGRDGEYSAIDRMEYSNRWVYTLAVDPTTYPVSSRNVRVNIDTNEVQSVDNNNNGNGQFYSKQFGNTTVMIDRSSNNQPGNLYVKENNRTKKIGNPNYIYGVSSSQQQRNGGYASVDNLEYSNRWVYTSAVDPAAYQRISKNVRINIDTNEVQMVDNNGYNNGNDQFYSKQFGNTTIMIDRSSNNQPGNLYVKENNRTKKIGNPSYIYGVSSSQQQRNGGYSSVDNLEYSNRWVYTSAVDPAAYPVSSKNVRINIDTNEVQFVN